jgi:hypothetical protein
LEPLACKSLGWQPVLQLGEQLAQVLKPEAQLAQPRVQVVQLEMLPVLGLLALPQPVQLLGHQIRQR